MYSVASVSVMRYWPICAIDRSMRQRWISRQCSDRYIAQRIGIGILKRGGVDKLRSAMGGDIGGTAGDSPPDGRKTWGGGDGGAAWLGCRFSVAWVDRWTTSVQNQHPGLLSMSWPSMVRLEWVPGESWGSKQAYCVIHQPVSVVLQCLLVPDCRAGCGDKCQRMGSGSALEALRDDALYKYMLLYFAYIPPIFRKYYYKFTHFLHCFVVEKSCA